ncbi:MAG: hypothetical protein ABI697_09685 [Devosia sp.]
MSIASFIVGTTRGLLVAAATSAAAVGLIAVFHPFAPEAETGVAMPSGNGLGDRIATLRASIRDAEGAQTSGVIGLAPGPAPTGQLEAQIASALERRDVAGREASEIRAALEANLALSPLAGIRDSTVVGQLLARQATLEGQIAAEGARLKPTHPVMRALFAQRDSLAAQVKAEAASIATALESEAKADAAQAALLAKQLAAMAASPPKSSIPTIPNTALAADRAELDRLLDAYMATPAARPAPGTADDLRTPTNLIVIGAAGLGAIVFQLLAASRRRSAIRAGEMAAWIADRDDAEADMVPPVELPTDIPLRRAS